MDLEKSRISLIKSDNAEYHKIHYWVTKNLGKADHCSNNVSHKANRYHWANISQRYRWDLTDWRQLCPTCHSAYDGVSKETKRLMSKRATGNRNRAVPVRCLELGKTWRNAREAAFELGVVHTAINNCLRGRAKTSAGYSWEYARGLSWT